MVLVLLALLGCPFRPPPGGPATPARGHRVEAGATNVLVVLLDDVGTNGIRAYGDVEDLPKTPVIDGLAAEGVMFRAAYANPSCSPTRAALLTGRFARRTGMGDALGVDEAARLSHAERTIPEMLGPRWHTAAVGKWHLAGKGVTGWERDALDQGFDSHRGSAANLVSFFGGLPGASYTHWEKLVNGQVSVRDRYATTDTIDDAIDAIRGMPEPWFTWVAPNAAHDPFHVPPAALIRTPLPEAPTRHQMFRASIEAVDHEIGRLLDAIDPGVRARTMVFVIGDNGTPGQVLPPPLDGRQGKHTVYETGTRVPFIVSGAGVTARGATSRALVHVVDLLPTVAAIAGADPRDGRPIDGFDLAPLLADTDARWPRDVVFTEQFRPVGPGPWDEEAVAVREKRYKLMELREHGELTERHLFDLRGRVDDGPDLLGKPLEPEAKEALARLESALAGYRALRTTSAAAAGGQPGR